jgi:hypothetical protein
MILGPLNKKGFNKTTVQFQVQKYLSNAVHIQNGLENGDVRSFVSKVPLDAAFGSIK